MIIWILYIAAGLVGLVAFMAVVGAFLPAAHVAARAAHYDHATDEVWRALRDRAAQPSWRHDLTAVEPLPDHAGKESFRERSRHGIITYVVDEVVAPGPGRAGRIVTRIADDKLPFGGRWIYDVAVDGGGTRLTVTEDGFVRNVIFRFMSRFVFGHTATLETFLRDLGRHLGETVTPEEVAPALAR